MRLHQNRQQPTGRYNNEIRINATKCGSQHRNRIYAWNVFHHRRLHHFFRHIYKHTLR